MGATYDESGARARRTISRSARMVRNVTRSHFTLALIGVCTLAGACGSRLKTQAVVRPAIPAAVQEAPAQVLLPPATAVPAVDPVLVLIANSDSYFRAG